MGIVKLENLALDVGIRGTLHYHNDGRVASISEHRKSLCLKYKDKDPEGYVEAHNVLAQHVEFFKGDSFEKALMRGGVNAHVYCLDEFSEVVSNFFLAHEDMHVLCSLKNKLPVLYGRLRSKGIDPSTLHLQDEEVICHVGALSTVLPDKEHSIERLYSQSMTGGADLQRWLTNNYSGKAVFRFEEA